MTTKEDEAIDRVIHDINEEWLNNGPQGGTNDTFKLRALVRAILAEVERSKSPCD